jgi:hypothetical protein
MDEKSIIWRWIFDGFFFSFCCLLVLNFEFYFFQKYCTMAAFLYAIGETLFHMFRGYWKPSGKICYTGSEGISNSLAYMQ